MSVNPRRTVDTVVRVGKVMLPNPIMLASGTAGHGAELARYLDLSSLGAVVVKSLSATPWAGNPPPRVHEAGAGSRPLWAKLSPNVTDITEIAAAALGAGAESLTLINTVMGMAIDPDTRSFRLGAGGGGLSGPPIHPVAVRAVYDCRVAFPDAAIVGVGGVTSGEDAGEFLLAGA